MKITPKTIITKDIIDSIKVGDIVPNFCGQMNEITEIFAKGISDDGKHFICFYQRFGDNSGYMTYSFSEDKPACNW